MNTILATRTIFCPNEDQAFIARNMPRLLQLGVLQPAHGGLDVLERAEHRIARVFVGAAFGVVDQRFEPLHEEGRSFLEAGHLFFPNELLFGAGEEILQVIDVVLGGLPAGVFGVHLLQVRFELDDGLLAPVDVSNKSL